MSDLPKELRDRDAIVLSGLQYCIPKMFAAAQKIEELEVENKRFSDQIEKLVKALQPFAHASADLAYKHQDSSDIWDSPAAMGITAKDLRAANKVVVDYFEQLIKQKRQKDEKSVP